MSRLDALIEEHERWFIDHFVGKLHDDVLVILGVDQKQWQEIEKNDLTDARYDLYYSILSSLLTKILAGSISKLTYYKEIQAESNEGEQHEEDRTGLRGPVRRRLG